MAMGEVSFSVESQCFLTNCQSIQEMSVLESISMVESMVFKVCDVKISCMGIFMDLGEEDMRTEETVIMDCHCGTVENI